MRHSEGILQRGPSKNLFYQWWEPENNTKAGVIIVHGFGEHSGRYANVVNTLVPEGYAVYAMDHRGHGRSFGKRGHVDVWENFRNDLEAFVEWAREKNGDNPLFIMGHSMGGLIVTEYMLQRRPRFDGVVISAPALTQGGVSPVLVFISRIASRLVPGLSMDTKLEQAAISRDPEAIRAYADDPLVHSMASARMGVEMQKAMDLVLARAGEFTWPVFIYHGTGDRIVPAADTKKLYEKMASEDKTHKEYAGYYHECHNDIGWETPVNDLREWLDARL